MIFAYLIYEIGEHTRTIQPRQPCCRMQARWASSVRLGDPPVDHQLEARRTTGIVSKWLGRRDRRRLPNGRSSERTVPLGEATLRLSRHMNCVGKLKALQEIRKKESLMDRWPMLRGCGTEGPLIIGIVDHSETSYSDRAIHF